MLKNDAEITKFYIAKRLYIVVVINVFISLLSITAQIQKEFTSRFNETVNGGITMIANNVLSRTATENYNEENDNHNFTDNVYVDIDNDNSTFNSSSANFVNPEPDLSCLTIKRAYVYWSAADKEKDNGEDNEPSWNFDDLKLMLPGENDYAKITADEVIYRGRDTHFSNDPYVCFKDITQLVAGLNSPYGKYQIANVETKTGFLTQHPNGNTGTSGGWQIVFIYESPALTTKNISIFDGYAHITQSFNNYDIKFSGFQTVPVGHVNAEIILGSLEGDRNLFGDTFQIKNASGNFENLTAPLRASDNFFNSRITLGNNNFIDRHPASLNTLGFDAALFELDNPLNTIIGNNQASTTIKLTSNQETYGLFLLGLSVDVWSPNLFPISLDSTTIANNTNPGESVLFDVNFANTGNDDAINLELLTKLPTNVEFVSANGLPNGVTFSYDMISRDLKFNIENGLVDVGDLPLNLEFELKINDICYFLETNCNLFFELQFEATYNGVENPNLVTTLSSNGLDDCQLGNVLPITINQPTVSWLNPIGDLDRTINTNDIIALNNSQNLEPTPNKCTFQLIKTSGELIPINSCAYSGTYTNTWTFTDACGKTIEDYIQTITINSLSAISNLNDVTISKAVTANGDSWNEYFTITNLESCEFSINLQIYNRWGALIYHTSDYKNNWNGFTNSSSIGSSKKVSTGTYFYIVSLMGSGLKPINGAIYVNTD